MEAAMSRITAATLVDVYQGALERCAPERLVRETIAGLGLADGVVDVVAIGKCAGRLFDGAATSLDVRSSLVCVPAGYPRPTHPAEVMEGTHPQVGPESFAAGRRAEEFVRHSDRHLLFLVSGGGSASVELPLRPWFDEDDLSHANAMLVRSALNIERINTARKHLSAIKGGRLALLAERSTTLIYSDVAADNEHEVASGPSVPDRTTNEEAAAVLQTVDDSRCRSLAERLLDRAVPDTPKVLPRASAHLIADNRTLLGSAGELAGAAIIDREFNDHVEAVAESLHRELRNAPAGTIVIAGGEPVVRVSGRGRGGRCTELAVRFARRCAADPLGEVHALFASSDGLDGNSGIAGVVMSWDRRFRLDRAAFERAVAGSDTLALAIEIGQPIRIPPTGNNLRDIFMMARY
jgi:hydroxypyruvate reductase